MEVYLLRHGIAEEGRSDLSDADRALTPEGRRKLRQTLQTASEADVQPTLILTSPLRRAMQTAEIAHQVLRCKSELISAESLTPNASVEEVWEEIRVHRGQSALLLVGHNPLFSDLGAYLLGAPSVQIDVKKGSLLRVDVESFSRGPRGILRWFLVPKLAATGKPRL